MSILNQRLESLRRLLGYESIQQFVDALNEWLKKPIPYATARRYHRDREPPVTYLRAVAHAFGVRLEWLVTGEGGMTEEEETARRLEENVDGGYATLAIVGIGVRVADGQIVRQTGWIEDGRYILVSAEPVGDAILGGLDGLKRRIREALA